MTFTVNDLAEVMSEDNDRWYGDQWSWLHYESDVIYTSLGKVTRLETDKAYRAEYEFDMYMIIEVQGRTFKKSGYYASYDGQHWDGDLVEVEKREVTREEWVEI